MHVEKPAPAGAHCKSADMATQETKRKVNDVHLCLCGRRREWRMRSHSNQGRRGSTHSGGLFYALALPHYQSQKVWTKRPYSLPGTFLLLGSKQVCVIGTTTTMLKTGHPPCDDGYHQASSSAILLAKWLLRVSLYSF